MPFVLAAGLPELLPAFVLILLLWAVWTLFQQPLIQLLENIPLVGYKIAAAVATALATVTDWVRSWVGTAVGPFVQLVAVPVNALLDFGSSVVLTIESVAHQVSLLAFQVFSRIGSLVDRLAAVIVRVGGLAATVTAILGTLATLGARIAHIISVTIPAAIAAVRAWASAAITHAVALLRTAVYQAIAAARAAAAAAVSALALHLASALGALRTAMLAAIATAVRPVQAELDALERAFGGAIAAVLARLATLEKLLPLTLLLPIVAAIPRTIADYWRTKQECVNPTCSLLGPLLDGLGDAGELLTGSVLLILVEQAIADPEGTAREVQGMAGVLRPLASDVTQVLAGRSV